MIKCASNFTADMVIQYSLVGLVLLCACVWIIIKIYKSNKKGSLGSCCGCQLSDHCKKLNHGNNKDLQQQYCGESGTKSK